MFYGLGSIAYGVKDSSISTFLLIFYNQVVGLPAGWVGGVIMAALILDAFLDPIIGQVSDHWRSRWGRRHPFMYASAVPVAVFFILLWNPPKGWSDTALLAYLLVVFIIARFCITLYEIPSSALTPELTTDYDQRTSLVSWRYFFGVLGNIGIVVIAYRFFLVRDAAHPVAILNRAGYGAFSLVAAAIMVASILVSAAGTHHRVKYLRRLAPRAPWKLRAVIGEMVQSLSNRSYISIVLAGLFSSMAIGVANGLTVYFNFYYWGFSTAQASTLAIAGVPGALIALVAAPAASRRLGKRNACVATATAYFLIASAPYVFKLLGLMPPEGSAALVAVIFATTLIALTFAIMALILYGSMIADVVEDSQIATGRRSEGLFFAASSFIQKAVSGIGVFLAGLLLALVRFPAHARPGAVDPEIVRHLVLIYIPAQVALYVVTMLMLLTYRIDRASHGDNLSKLADAADAAAAIEIPAPGR